VSQSALMRTIHGPEERFGIRLLTRTAGKVTSTKVSERLPHAIDPRLEEIEAED
jgi:DNA-binding transcriptional LysR family regulator